MADERGKAIELAVAQIEKQFGKGSIMRLGSKEAIVPIAASSEIEPVEITETGTMASFDPRRRIEPLPNCFSIWLRASSKARERSFSSILGIAPGIGGKEILYQPL